MLGYGSSADSFDQYYRMAESSILLCVKTLCKQLVVIYCAEYLRSPNADDITRLLQVAEMRGFPGMLGSLDCMHWGWKNCPTAVAGQYRGRHGGCTIILEAVASYDLWIWHAYFGLPGTNNDINVLNASNLFANLLNGRSPPANYSLMGKHYNTGYYLADGIYPKWSTLVKTIRKPRNDKEEYFSKMQESYRKDIEQAFGVLQARFAIVRGKAHFWDKDDLHNVMTACIIMHNMIVEDERSGFLNQYVYTGSEASEDTDYTQDPDVQQVTVERNRDSQAYRTFIQRHASISDKAEHLELQDRLIHHLANWRAQH